MLPLQLDVEFKPVPRAATCEGSMAFLNHLRFVAMSCRAKRRADLFEACALLHVTKSASREAHAEALMRCLSQALGRTPKLFAAGTVEMSFDEAWLVQLGRASAANDDASIRFLLNSQVVPEHRRLVGFLLRRISEFFSLN